MHGIHLGMEITTIYARNAAKKRQKLLKCYLTTAIALCLSTLNESADSQNGKPQILNKTLSGGPLGNEQCV